MDMNIIRLRTGNLSNVSPPVGSRSKFPPFFGLEPTFFTLATFTPDCTRAPLRNCVSAPHATVQPNP